jgi:hypothetical protein
MEVKIAKAERRTCAKSLRRQGSTVLKTKGKTLWLENSSRDSVMNSEFVLSERNRKPK